jgi:mannose-1-phosphate guanylyltransferase
MTLGILPTFANTGYGYIEFDKLDSRPVKKVKQFREKPDYATARKFIQSRNFLWNAGIFVWSAKTVLKAYEEFQPVMFAHFMNGIINYSLRYAKSIHTDMEKFIRPMLALEKC